MAVAALDGKAERELAHVFDQAGNRSVQFIPFKLIETLLAPIRVAGVSNHRFEFGECFHWLIPSGSNRNWMVGGFSRRTENL
jgi:hypothetical protein